MFLKGIFSQEAASRRSVVTMTKGKDGFVSQHKVGFKRGFVCYCQTFCFLESMRGMEGMKGQQVVAHCQMGKRVGGKLMQVILSVTMQHRRVCARG